MKLIPIIFCMILSVSQIQGAEAIKGAFGIEFGNLEDFIKWPHNKEETKEIKENTYRYETPKGYRIFQKCWFKVTPKTQKIFQIYSFYEAEDEKNAENEVEIIKEAIKQKYKSKIEQYKSSLESKYDQAILFRSGNRYIQILRDKKRLYVTYGDYDWQKLSQKEAIEDSVKRSLKEGI